MVSNVGQALEFPQGRHIFLFYAFEGVNRRVNHVKVN